MKDITLQPSSELFFLQLRARFKPAEVSGRTLNPLNLSQHVGLILQLVVLVAQTLK